MNIFEDPHLHQKLKWTTQWQKQHKMISVPWVEHKLQSAIVLN